MTQYSDQIIACDFFTIETLFLKTFYVLVFIEHGTRRVYFAGCTTRPNGKWVTQQARQMLWQLEDQGKKVKFLIRDNDSKFAKSFDNVFQSVGIKVITTPFQAPNANAYTERWIRTVRNECTDNILILNQKHLKQVLKEYIEYYNTRRPHQGLDHQSPIPHTIPKPIGRVKRKKVLGGIINDYYRDTA